MEVIRQLKYREILLKSERTRNYLFKHFKTDQTCYKVKLKENQVTQFQLAALGIKEVTIIFDYYILLLTTECLFHFSKRRSSTVLVLRANCKITFNVIILIFLFISSYIKKVKFHLFQNQLYFLIIPNGKQQQFSYSNQFN